MKIALRIALLLFISRFAWAVETPATMLITGTVEGRAAVTPAIGDTLVVLNRGTGALEAKGNILSRQGLFAITIAKTSDFNDTPLTIQFEKDGSRYELLEGDDPADFSFRGGLVPTRVSATLTVGARVGDAVSGGGSSGGGSDGSGSGDGDGGDGDGGDGSSGSGTGSGGETGETAASNPFDINDDGVVDQLDIELVKAVVAGKLIEKRADVNSDGLVNTRDIIAVIRAVNRAERQRRRSRAKTSLGRTSN